MLREAFFWLLVFGGIFMGLLLGAWMMNSTIGGSLRLHRAKKRMDTGTDRPPVAGPDYLALLGTILPQKRGPRAAGAEPMDNTLYVEEDHYEAHLYSVNATEDFVSHLPKNWKRLLPLLLKDMDFNSDGFVDRRELEVWIKSSLRSQLEQDAVKRFAVINRKRDRVITWKELYAIKYGPKDEEQIQSDPKDEVKKQMMADDQEKFEAADSNKDGGLSLKEFKHFIAPEEFPQMFDHLLKIALRSKDTNTDGRVDFQEFVAGYSGDDDNEWLQVEKKRFDTEYDKNGDGYLIGTEILAWQFPSNDVLTERQVVYLFETVDKDKDGRLSYREFYDRYDTVKATDSDKSVEEL